MKQFQKIYEENKKLDQIFDQIYDNYNPEIIEKNIIELLVELGELANETRCFKYWSNKKPSDKDIILEEYADCFIMILYFCNMVNIELTEQFVDINYSNIIIQLKELYKIVSQLNYELDRNIIKLILSNLLNLARLLNFSDEDIIHGTLKKIEKNKARFITGF